MVKKLILIFGLLISVSLHAENGYRLWMNYKSITDHSVLAQYRFIGNIYINGNSPTLGVIRNELEAALPTLLARSVKFSAAQKADIIITRGGSTDFPDNLRIQQELKTLGEEGFLIRTLHLHGRSSILITANKDVGLLYGVFHFIRLLQTNQPITNLNIRSTPAVKLRLLNHWDNLNRTVERGYAGFSIWKWHTLPTYIDPRYTDYARANASIGINGTVLTNVNANAIVLTPAYLTKVKALADVFRPYGIKVYLTARFSAPVEIGGLKTADPLNKNVQKWWNNKVKEIYDYIPDFGGFLVKANSEGQPGPQDYGRTHADGANMLADAMKPFNGIVIWRAFVYSHEVPDDRHKQAYSEFVPLDGKFRENVMLQVKNGAIDFMPREPFHPLFGAMPKTPLMMEFQVTQEYTGQGTHLVFLAPLFKECLDSDTWAKGKGTTVAKILEGRIDHHSISGIAGVSNIGDDINWCGHPFAQANWYALGRLCWDPGISSSQIADEWLRMTFSNNSQFVKSVKEIMLASREIMVSYMNPLGLHHIMAAGNHYGPGPWVDNQPRADWNSVYYHKASVDGIGFDRTSSGSNAIAQYFPGARKQWEDPGTCDEKYLLWFHHVSWNFRMKSGRTLWNELCYKYYAGADSVKWMQEVWQRQKNLVDEEQFRHVNMLLNIQREEAKWWRNACLLYFQTFSKQPIPTQYEQPANSLEYYESLKFPYAPGINNTN
jgi:alpha-glucuronidase